MTAIIRSGPNSTLGSYVTKLRFLPQKKKGKMTDNHDDGSEKLVSSAMAALWFLGGQLLETSRYHHWSARNHNLSESSGIGNLQCKQVSVQTLQVLSWVVIGAVTHFHSSQLSNRSPAPRNCLEKTANNNKRQSKHLLVFTVYCIWSVISSISNLNR